jgi:hypothetical protein
MQLRRLKRALEDGKRKLDFPVGLLRGSKRRATMEPTNHRVHPINIEPPILLALFKMILFGAFNKIRPRTDSAIRHLPPV